MLAEQMYGHLEREDILASEQKGCLKGSFKNNNRTFTLVATTMELFVTIVNSFQPLTILTKVFFWNDAEG